ncbi:unnamed protein product [Ectocarpus sp. 6 AP-2014]
MHTAAVRFSALGTRIAAVAPPPFSAPPETTDTALASEERLWKWNQSDTAGTARVKTVAGAKKRVKSTRPASAPLRRRTGGGIAHSGGDGGASARGYPPRQLNKSRGQKKAVAWDGFDVSGASGMVARRVQPGKPRTRPASAQSSSRTSASPSTAAATGTNTTTNRTPAHRGYCRKRLPPPRDDNSSASGDWAGGGGGRRRAGGGRRDCEAGEFLTQRVARAPMAPEALNFGGGVRNARDWDDRGALALAPTASSRRAAAAKLAASAARSAEAAARAAGTWESPDRERARRGAAGAGRPYMSRAELAAEGSKELAELRKEVDHWKTETENARAEANEARKRLEDQEEHVAGVLHQHTTSMLPTYRYGLDLTGNGSAKNGPSRGPPQRQLAILEHRRELEKSLVVRRLREQLSRVTERLAHTEEELMRLKRSCQFTALAEMLTAGEEYVSEVERLRAKLDENPNGNGTSPARAACPAPFMSRVVDIPSAVTALKPKTSHKRGTTRPEKGEEPIRNGSPSVAVDPADKEECSLSSDGAMSTRHNPRQEDAGRDHSRQRPHNPRNPDDLPQLQHQLQQHQQQGYPQSPQTATSPQESAVRDRKDSRGGRQRQRKGEVLVSSRAKAGLLGVLAPGGSRGYMKIDGPIATGSSLGRDRAKRGVDARGASGTEKSGRVGLTTEMEVDVMKGLVLAQHQRIERQRTRMQELERDLSRDYRRATVLGGEWPPPPWLRQMNLPAWKGGLTPSRSAPAGLDRFTGARFAATGNNSGNGSKIDNDGRRAFASSGSASRSAACSPQRQQRQKERRGSGGGEGGGGSGIANPCPVERNDDWAEDTRGTKAVFSPKRRQTSSSCCSSVASMTNNRNGNRRRPATAGGNTRAEWRRIRGNRCGHSTIATGSDGTAGKYRPRSASSRLYTPPEQSGDNQTSQWARNGSTSVGGDVNVGNGGGGAGFGWEAEKAGLPEGWTEAVDEESGHVYFFSETRSTWVKPVAPASPRTPDSSHSLEACQATNAINGDGNEDAHSVILSTAATGLADSLPQAAEATTPEVAISTRERDKPPDGILEDGRLVERVDTKAASTAVLARPVDSPDEEQEDSTETHNRPETGQNVPPAANGSERAVGEGEGGGKREERHGSLHRLSSTSVRGFSNGSSRVPESASGFDDAMLPIRGRSGNSAPSDHRRRGPSWPSNNGLDGSILAGTRTSLSVVHDTVDAFTSTSLPQKIVEGKASSRANGIQPEEAEPSRPREASGVDRLSSDVQDEAGPATSRARSSLLPEARKNDEGDDDVEGYKTTSTCYRANCGSDQSSPPQVSQTEALPATESSPDAADDVATDALVSNTASAKTNETPPLESTPCSYELSVNDNNNIENETSASIAPAGDDADAIDARTTRVSPASVLAAGVAPGSPLSLEETESAMAALIAKLRPSLEPSLSPEESKVAAAAVDFETGGNGPDPGLGSTTAPLLTAGDEGKSGNYPEGLLSVSWDMTAMQESTDGGGGVSGKTLDGEASEAATGMYEDDFDDD